MKPYKTIFNKYGKKIDLYLCKCDINDGYYIIGIPENMKDNVELFVETYNSGGMYTHNYSENINHAMTKDGNPIENTYADFITDFPIVVPIIPSLINQTDFQQLSIGSVVNFKLHEMVKDGILDAKKKIFEITGKNVQNKIFLSGYSASGVFAQRFALIYPELINRALIGGAAGSIPVPIYDIDYPVGIRNFKELFGKEFDLDSYKKIQFGYFVAENEAKKPGNYDIEGKNIISDEQIRSPMHDMSFRYESIPTNIGFMQRKLFGYSLDERYKNSISENKKLGIDIEGIIVTGSSHRRIHDEIVTPSSKFLHEQMILFYLKHKQLNPKYYGCCENIDNSYQQMREEVVSLK